MTLNEQIAENIESILNKLGIEYSEHYNRLSLACPIHGGDNPNGCCIYTSSDFVPNFKCYTKGCHLEHGSSLTNFLCQTLKKNKYELIKWLKNFDIVDSGELPNNFIKNTNILTRSRKTASFNIPKHVLNKLNFNARLYFDKEGITEETLKFFGVGICTDRGKPFFNYIVVPIFDDNDNFIIGYTARTIYKKCLICGQYHHEHGVCNKNGQQKWKHSKGFSSGSFLYNFWNAKKHIIKTGRVLLVEGPKDVWKLWQNGVKNVVAVFGNSLSQDQKLILESLPINTVGIFFDPDLSGITGAKRISEYLDRFYNTVVIDYHKQPSLCSKHELLRIFRK